RHGAQPHRDPGEGLALGRGRLPHAGYDVSRRLPPVVSAGGSSTRTKRRPPHWGQDGWGAASTATLAVGSGNWATTATTSSKRRHVCSRSWRWRLASKP